MASIFSRIVQGEIPAYKVAETEDCLAFLDIRPLAKGHTLVIPKKEVDFIFDLEPQLFSELMSFVHKIGGGLQKLNYAQRVGMAVIGLEVPHAHVHLVPINGIYDIDFSKPKLEFSQEEFVSIARQIADAIEM